MRCCICYEIIVGIARDGHNAQPIASGRCCGYCNNTVVVPERFKRLVLQRHADETKRVLRELDLSEEPVQ